jgi:hypothetical protein
MSRLPGDMKRRRLRWSETLGTCSPAAMEQLRTRVRCLLPRINFHNWPRTRFRGMSSLAFRVAAVNAGELWRVLWLVPLVDQWRRGWSLHRAVALARSRGIQRAARSPSARLQLRRVIGAVDRRLPGGQNCVRRALLEMALDGSAAREQFFAGLQTGGGPGSGHAWLESNPTSDRYDAVIAI